MALFKRRKGTQPPAGEPEPTGADVADLEVEGDGAAASAAAGGEGDQGGEPDAARPPDPEFDRGEGPFDVSETDSSLLLDLGGVRINGVEGMQLQLEVDQEQQVITSVTASLADSHLQLQGFAAPRSRGLWREIRDEIAKAVDDNGGTWEEVQGPLGVELRTRMPTAGPDGRTVFAPMRFLGVDGPRWFLRGVLSGRAAIDDAAAETLLGVFRGTVVVRGSEPMGPRELLPLRLPEDEKAPPAEPGPGTPTMTDLNPFERGPEITEVG